MRRFHSRVKQTTTLIADKTTRGKTDLARTIVANKTASLPNVSQLVQPLSPPPSSPQTLLSQQITTVIITIMLEELSLQHCPSPM